MKKQLRIAIYDHLTNHSNLMPFLASAPSLSYLEAYTKKQAVSPLTYLNFANVFEIDKLEVVIPNGGKEVSHHE